MNEGRKAETITLGGNVEYAKVSTRLLNFHNDHQEQCGIQTECTFKEGFVLFSASVTTSKGTFTGHSMDKISGRQKQFEKQETIAVGRALAFAGYLASGEIACAEEMQQLVTVQQLNSLKLKYSKEYSDELKNLDRDMKSQKFNAWAKEVIGEDVDYREAHSWEPAWFKRCWQELSGVDPDVPFEE